MTPAVLAVASLFASLRLSEVLPDPSRVEDARGEYIEIENPDAVAFTGGFRLVVGGKDTVVATRDTIPSGGYWILSRTLEADNGGFRPDLAVPAGWSLANGSGNVALLDAAGVVVDYVSWSGANAGTAIERCPDGIWRGSAGTFGAGDRGTPGAPNSCDSAPRPVEGRVDPLVRRGDTLCAVARNRGTAAWMGRTLTWRNGAAVARVDTLVLAPGGHALRCLGLPGSRAQRTRWSVQLPSDVRPADDTAGIWVRDADGEVVIAELQASEPGPEWIEIAQGMDQAFDLGGWSIGAEAPRGILPAGSVIPAAGRLVLSSDCAALRALVGVSTLACAEPAPWPRLSVEEDVATLRDPDGGLWDSVSWQRATWGAWPRGRTRERQDLAPFGGPEDWLPSASDGGTPGYGPADAPGWSDGAGGTHAFRIPSRRVRPNDSRRMLRMEIAAPRDEEIRIDLYDMGRRQILRIHDGAPPRGGMLAWDGRDARGREVRPGVYAIVAEFGPAKRPAWKAREWIVVSPAR